MDIGVVGDIVAHEFDEEGRVLDIPANRRAINLDAESIRRIPKVIAVSGSVAKARAIAAALRGGFCSCLVTDAHAAQTALALHREYTAHRTSHRQVEGQGSQRQPSVEAGVRSTAD
jgi:DNA-binding transcriptional regulator LsrR (DeoR family)